MKLKIKPSYIGLFLIGIMFFSTFAFAMSQSFVSGPAQPKKELPTTNVVNYRLPADQESELLSRGITILEYQYDESCKYCQQQKLFLEQLTTNSKISDQLFLELVSSGNELPSLTLTSYYSQTELANATDREVISALCKVLINKPVECALQQV